MQSVAVLSPAKINLFLAVTGPRPDGFHDLVSLAAPLDWGDRLTAEPAASTTLTCDDPRVPLDESNLVLRAAAAYRAATGWAGGAAFSLEKRIPMGAGLGGGSSNAVGALRALNQLAGSRLSGPELRELALGLGSDCAIFLSEGPSWMRGRGETTEPADAPTAARLRGRRVLVFKPDFPISTAWAYGRMRSAPGRYMPGPEAEARIAAWRAGGPAPAEELLFNNMEGPAFAKFPALPALLEALRRDFGLAPRMSGSGSACFALLPAGGGPQFSDLAGAIRAAWGPSAWVIETRLK